MQKSMNVPPTHLHTSRVLKEESHVWDEVKSVQTGGIPRGSRMDIE
ncbi:hypothetical protein cypCar_00045137, partial [Cyprinus carpio]